MSFIPQHPTVWIELPVSDMEKSMAFYSAATGLTLNRQEMDGNDVAMFESADLATSVGGHLYKGNPSGDGSGPTVHLACEGKLEEAMDRVKSAGGEVISEPIAIPFGRFFYAKDLDGNSIGLFEAA